MKSAFAPHLINVFTRRENEIQMTKFVDTSQDQQDDLTANLRKVTLNINSIHLKKKNKNKSGELSGFKVQWKMLWRF